MRMLHFVDGAADQTFIPSDKINGLQVTDADTVVIYAQVVAGNTGSGSGADAGVDKVTLTATDNAAAVALRLADAIAATNIGGSSVLTIKASTAPFAEVGTVAYSSVA